MNAATAQAVICLILAIIAVATFLLQGKQWPTFISATLFGMFAGSTDWGGAVMKWVSAMLTQLIKSFQS